MYTERITMHLLSKAAETNISSDTHDGWTIPAQRY